MRKMRVTASEVLRKMGAPLPGAASFPPRPRVAPSPERPAAPQQGAAPPTDLGQAGDEFLSEDEPQQQQQEATPTVQEIVQQLDRFFSDENVEEISGSMLTLMKVVPPESGEKLSKVFTKLMEAMMAMKANIAALQVMAMPAQQQQQLMQQNLQQLTQAAPVGDQGIKTGPIT